MSTTLLASKFTTCLGLSVFTTLVLLLYVLAGPSRNPNTDHIESRDQLLKFASYANLQTIQPDTDERWPHRIYKSSPFKPPVLNITKHGGDLAEGVFFFTPKSKLLRIAQELPVIMSQENDLVFAFANSSSIEGGFHGFHPHDVNGKPFLSIWFGTLVLGHGYGKLTILDDEYNEREVSLQTNIVPTIEGSTVGHIDYHEHQMTERGTMLVTAFNSTPYDLSPVGGRSDGHVTDSLFYEIDIVSNKVIFSWSALDHFNITQSRLPLPCYMSDGSRRLGYDFFHINSVQAIGDYFLISSRHQWTLYLISRQTGRVVWGLDGSRQNVNLSWPLPEGRFSWQHHARALNFSDEGFVLSVFDNHNAPFDTDKVSSRALLFDVLFGTRRTETPTLLHRLEAPKAIFSQTQGSYVSALENGNQLMGHGSIPVIREYGPGNCSSDVRSEIRFGSDNGTQFYRAFKKPWRATPKSWSPSLVIERSVHNDLKLYVSWNGATEVTHWIVYAVDPSTDHKELGFAVKRGFETVIEIPHSVSGIRCMMVAAVQEGIPIRQSNQACLAT